MGSTENIYEGGFVKERVEAERKVNVEGFRGVWISASDQQLLTVKTEIGHWESDTMIGGNHLGVLVTHVDKASKFLVAGLAKNKTASEINRVTEELFQEIPIEKRKTFTCDNGKEFCGHQELSRKLGADFYFATPYHSWERGLNEHTNGLLRQFFPKGTNFKIVKPEAVKRAVNLINNRPRQGNRTHFLTIRNKSIKYSFQIFYRA